MQRVVGIWHVNEWLKCHGLGLCLAIGRDGSDEISAGLCRVRNRGYDLGEWIIVRGIGKIS